ncbi:MAG: DNA/RNA nuclease SfsA [Spirochaetaceae bacterium]|jgi:sugar fermentation stimulation protein A|nr:DNA/RNA nuclease SfsA [Spirochaetaceae bacterium]
MKVRLLENHREAVFIRRPNRFLIIAGDGEEIPCHCPNPGRLIEFFGFRGRDIPGIRLILEKREGKKHTQTAKTAYTAVGLYYRPGLSSRECIVPLFSSRANRAAQFLVLKEIIPGLKEIHPEYTLGNSRFDFLCTDERGRRHVVEVKACSLVEQGVAMFPDAPSERALKHLEELAALNRRGYVCHVLFIIVHGRPRVFIPNLHTDPELAAGLSRLGRTLEPAPAAIREHAGPGVGRKNGKGRQSGKVLIHAALLRLDRQGDAVLAKAPVPVDLSHGQLAESDRGSYLIILELPKETETEVGSLGKICLKPGWYVYAGSAQKNLRARVNRHLRKTGKEKHWHLDYLTPFAGSIKALPFMSYRNLECALSAELAALGGTPVRSNVKGKPGFGASDCTGRCASHLWYFAEPPVQDRAFVDMIFRYRHAEALCPAGR